MFSLGFGFGSKKSEKSEEETPIGMESKKEEQPIMISKSDSAPIAKVVIDKSKILAGDFSGAKPEEKKKEFDADKVNAILA